MKIIENKKKTRGNKDKLTLEAISELGGNKDDLQLLHGVEDDSDSELENPLEDFDADPIRKDEIKKFLKELDIFKHRPKDLTKDEQKKEKSLETEDGSQQSTSPLLGETKRKKKESSPHREPAVEEEIPQPSTSSEEGKKKKKKQKNKYKIQHDEVSSTTVDPSAELVAHMRSYQPRKYLLVKAGGETFDKQEPNGRETLTEPMVKQMEDFAGKLLRDEISVYNKQKENKKRSDVGWMRTVLSSGTLADKMAALTVLVQESPLHSLQHIDTLISMARKKGKRECLSATDTLKELFLSEILPEDRKLKTFAQRPLSSVGQAAGWNKDVVDRRLLMWYFESQLKDKYAEFVKALQVMSHDTLPATKQKTVGTVYQLLVKKPEQEKVLLSMLINKVGDPDYKLASKVSHYLSNLVEAHPNMKSVVVREVEQLLFRPNIPTRAQYYSVCFLNQLSLSHCEKELAGQLIKIYFSFFKAYVKKGEVDSKMMSALLSGVNRAFPYAKLELDFLDGEMENLYKIVHMVNFNTSIQALMLLYQVMGTSENISERFYITLYKKLSDPALKTSSKQAMFLNLVFKSLNKDSSDRRIKAFVKRLLQVCYYQQPQFTCGALILLSEVLKDKPGLLLLSHVEEQPQFTCGALILLSEVLKDKPGLLLLSHVEEDSDEEEHFVDLHDPDSETETQDVDNKDEDNNDAMETKSTVKPGYSWFHRSNMNHKSEKSDYDPYHRNPQYCHAENSCIWELEKLADHYHPTVSLFAKQILKGESVSYSGDPLQDFTLIRFLDRFVYKNPKKLEDVKEKVSTISCNQSKPSGIKSIPVNSEQFMKLEETKVPVDDRFLHRYFTQKAARKKKEEGLSDEDSDADSVGDAEFDEYLDKYEENLDGGDFGDLELDFAEEFGRKKGRKKGGSDSDVSDDDFGDDADLDDNLSDEEVGFSDDGDLAEQFKAADDMDEDVEFSDDGDITKLFKEADDIDDDDEDGGLEDSGERLGFNEEDIEFSDDDELQELAPTSMKGKKRKDRDSGGSMIPKKKGRKSSPGLFAAAEEFSHMMDENAGSKIDSTGAEALANTDKADVKQLKWEAERDRWIHGKNDWRRKKGGKSGRKPGHFKPKGKQFSGKGQHKGKWKKK